MQDIQKNKLQQSGALHRFTCELEKRVISELSEPALDNLTDKIYNEILDETINASRLLQRNQSALFTQQV